MSALRFRKWQVWLLFAVMFSIFFLVVETGVSRIIMWTCLGVFYLSFYSLAKRSLQVVSGIRTFLIPSILFGVGYFIIFYLPYQAYLIGSFWIDYSLLFDRTYVEQTNRALVASTVGILAFTAGVMALPSRVRVDAAAKPTNGAINVRLELSLIGLALGLSIAILHASGGIALLLSGSYSGSSTNDRASDGLYFMANMLSMMGAAAAVISVRNTRYFSPLALAVGALSVGWAVLLLIMGDRNGFFLVAISGVVAFATYIRSISRPMIAALALVGLLLYQGVEVSRTTQNRGINEVVQGVLDVGDSDKHLDESSFNLSTIVTRSAFSSVPEQYDYFMGKFKLIGFMGIIPFSRRLIVSDADPFVTSADFLTFIMIGSQAGWAVGTTVVADIYLDFGILGILVLMFCVGWWATYVTQRARDERKTIAWGVLFSMSAALFAELPRYSLDFPVRNLVWAAIFFAAIYVARVFRVRTDGM